MTKLLIIADDLTGAIEAGVQLRKKNIASMVVARINPEFKPVLDENVAVVVNTESRHLPPEMAAEKVSLAVKMASESGVRCFYKKTDSTLRGNIGAELEAFLKGTKQKVLPYIPGHPRMKRFTVNGYQFLDKTPLHKTNFANDPLEPVVENFVPGVLKKQTNLETLVLPPNGILKSDEYLSRNKKIVVFDCNSVKDLEQIGYFLRKMNWHKAMAGTSAMVEIFPDILPLPASPSKNTSPKQPILFINGSVNSNSLEQVEYADEKGISAFVIPQQLFKDVEEENEIQDFIQKIKKILYKGKNVIVSSTDFAKSKNADRFFHNQSNQSYIHSVPKKIGEIVLQILHENCVNTIGVFGGDTLAGILEILECDKIEPCNELLPGVAFASALTKFGSIQLITKPGGYGERDEIMKIVNHIKSTE